MAAGTFIGGPVGDRIGRKYVIWCSIFGILPFTLALPYANLFRTTVLSVVIGLRKWLHRIVVVQRFSCLCSSSVLSTVSGRGRFRAPRRRWNGASTRRTRMAPHMPRAWTRRNLRARSSFRDALMQVVMHSEHHRAQVAMRLRALGGTPPVTDYIVWVRDVRGRG